MDIRQQYDQTTNKSKVNSKTQIQNITSMAVYNLTKKNSIYNQLSSQCTQSVKSQMGNLKFITVYSYKPLIYSVLAVLYHMQTRRFGITHLFIHTSAILLFNQYDLNSEMKRVNQQKWQQYIQASKNYKLALSLQKVSIWKYLSSFAEQQINLKDFQNIFKLRPY